MSYIKAKMSQIRFRLGLCPRPRWRSSDTVLPQTSYLDFKGPTYKGREGERGQGLGMGGKRQGREKGLGGREGGAWGGKRKEGGGMEGISLPHGHLKTLAALDTGH